MCGIVGFLDRTGGPGGASGATVLAMLEALACRGPDGSGVAVLGEPNGLWSFRVTRGPGEPPPGRETYERLGLGEVVGVVVQGATVRVSLRPGPGLTPSDVERALETRRGGPEVLCAGPRIDLAKQVGAPSELEASYGVSGWRGPVAVGHTRMSTESAIDLSHSQPFWAHGMADVATVHNGHVTNYHKLRRSFERDGVVFHTDNDSEVIGVYLRARVAAGRTLAQAMADSLDDLDGAYNYLVASPDGLGVVRDRHGFKPLCLAAPPGGPFLAVATEETALRRAIPGDYRVTEPPPGRAVLYPAVTRRDAVTVA